MNWIRITNQLEISEVLGKMGMDPSSPYIIFKHSTRCGTSTMAKKMFEKHWNVDTPVFLIHVIEDRILSNFISKKYEIIHESPQVLLIKNEKCIYNASHYQIDAKEIHQEMLK